MAAETWLNAGWLCHADPARYHAPDAPPGVSVRGNGAKTGKYQAEEENNSTCILCFLIYHVDLLCHSGRAREKTRIRQKKRIAEAPFSCPSEDVVCVHASCLLHSVLRSKGETFRITATTVEALL